MRVLIVDDEPLAQTALANILSARSDVEHFDSANDASEALEKLATDSYDVLLLDIDILDLSGTELVDQLMEGNLPLLSIVFVTVHVEHAVAAFEKCTVDYVLKPFFDRADQRSLGPRLSENGGRARRKIDRSLAAIAAPQTARPRAATRKGRSSL
jgi:DNA-binding LytR/AlgR family response regulator